PALRTARWPASSGLPNAACRAVATSSPGCRRRGACPCTRRDACRSRGSTSPRWRWRGCAQRGPSRPAAGRTGQPCPSRPARRTRLRGSPSSPGARTTPRGRPETPSRSRSWRQRSVPAPAAPACHPASSCNRLRYRCEPCFSQDFVPQFVISPRDADTRRMFVRQAAREAGDLAPDLRQRFPQQLPAVLRRGGRPGTPDAELRGEVGSVRELGLPLGEVRPPRRSDHVPAVLVDDAFQLLADLARRSAPKAEPGVPVRRRFFGPRCPRRRSAARKGFISCFLLFVFRSCNALRDSTLRAMSVTVGCYPRVTVQCDARVTVGGYNRGV